MRRVEREIHSVCPGCAKRVYCGPIRSGIFDDEVDVGDVIDESVDCPNCGCELSFQVEREWDEKCYICGEAFPHDGPPVAEWQETLNRYLVVRSL